MCVFYLTICVALDEVSEEVIFGIFTNPPPPSPTFPKYIYFVNRLVNKDEFEFEDGLVVGYTLDIDP